MKGKQLTQLIGILGLFCVVLLGVYFGLNRREDDSIYAKDKEVNTEAQTILKKDIDRNYPATVREVVEVYSRISKCLYNEKVTEEEFESLVIMMRKLYDEELLENNPLSEHTEGLLVEVIAAKSNDYYMTRYQVQKQSSVTTWTAEENKFASIIACYTVNNNGTYEKTYEEFLLREDENNRWKIVGWRLTEPVEIGD